MWFHLRLHWALTIDILWWGSEHFIERGNPDPALLITITELATHEDSRPRSWLQDSQCKILGHLLQVVKVRTQLQSGRARQWTKLLVEDQFGALNPSERMQLSLHNHECLFLPLLIQRDSDYNQIFWRSGRDQPLAYRVKSPTSQAPGGAVTCTQPPKGSSPIEVSCTLGIWMWLRPSLVFVDSYNSPVFLWYVCRFDFVGNRQISPAFLLVAWEVFRKISPQRKIARNRLSPPLKSDDTRKCLPPTQPCTLYRSKSSDCRRFSRSRSRGIREHLTYSISTHCHARDNSS